MSHTTVADDSGHGHGDDHPDYLQHHFDTPIQQYDSVKLGMWLFLATEILLFGGLFCAYAVYRSNHPEIFIYAHTFLDTNLGAINTVILLCSSLTMAWAVRASQLGQIKLMTILMALTLAGGFGFMGIKYVEYKAKWQHGLLWAGQYDPHVGGHGEGHAAGTAGDHGEGSAGELASGVDDGHDADGHGGAEQADPAAGDHGDAESRADGSTSDSGGDGSAGGFRPERTTLAAPGEAPRGLAAEHMAAGHSAGQEPANAQTFFSIYFLMTGLHGLHVIVGMLAIAWVMLKGLRGRISAAYYTPVDLVGLYWHLVDLIWIFLFPLLYLIH